MTQPPSNLPPTPGFVKASLTALPKGEPVYVHFNPASLVYTLENQNPQQSGDPDRRQYAATFSGKLTMDLQFDTTDTGSDVRNFTSQIAQFMEPSANANKGGNSNSNGTNPPAPSVLSFDWGAYHFQGFMDSFKETIDFFSADGIPLRSLVSITLSRQDKVFDAGAPPSGTAPASSLVPTSGGGTQTPNARPPANGMSTTDIATQGGDPNAGRALASANGLENARFTGGASLEVGGGIQLNGPVAFVTSASAGGAGASGGVGVSAGAAGKGALASGGGALFGSRASAGVPATAGAFAGLETGRATTSTTTQLDPLMMLPATVGSDVSTGANASFGLGGFALAPTGFSTKVGTVPSFTNGLTFDDD